MYSGTGIGGTVFPFLVSGLLSKFGYKPAMISLGLGFLVLNGTALMFIKRRVPLALGNEESARRRIRIDWSFAGRRTFAVGCLVILGTGLGNFVPSLWLPCEFRSRCLLIHTCVVT